MQQSVFVAEQLPKVYPESSGRWRAAQPFHYFAFRGDKSGDSRMAVVRPRADTHDRDSTTIVHVPEVPVRARRDARNAPTLLDGREVHERMPMPHAVPVTEGTLVMRVDPRMFQRPAQAPTHFPRGQDIASGIRPKERRSSPLKYLALVILPPIVAAAVVLAITAAKDPEPQKQPTPVSQPTP